MQTPSEREKSESKKQVVDQALTASKEVAEEIKDAAEELSVVHAVLDTQLSEKALPEDVEEAVARTQELEGRLNDSAKKLDAANEVLERAVQR